MAELGCWSGAFMKQQCWASVQGPIGSKGACPLPSAQLAQAPGREQALHSRVTTVTGAGSGLLWERQI